MSASRFPQLERALRGRSVVPLLMLRHGKTQWNLEGRLQGQTDVALCASARSELAGLSLPEPFDGWRWVSSPLCRASETAELISGLAPETDERLVEMNWGDWEGLTHEQARHRTGCAEYDRMLALGPAFRPPGGESPREVQQRLVRWGDDLGQGAAAPRASDARVVVTHKGVLKALLGLVFDWGLTGKNPVKLDWDRAHLFAFEPGDSRFSLLEPNIPLVDRAVAGGAASGSTLGRDGRAVP